MLEHEVIPPPILMISKKAGMIAKRPLPCLRIKFPAFFVILLPVLDNLEAILLPVLLASRNSLAYVRLIYCFCMNLDKEFVENVGFS